MPSGGKLVPWGSEPLSKCTRRSLALFGALWWSATIMACAGIEADGVGEVPESVLLLGCVVRPGNHRLTRGATLGEFLRRAGGLDPPMGHFKVVILGSRGQEVTGTLGIDPPSSSRTLSIPLKSGDKVLVRPYSEYDPE